MTAIALSLPPWAVPLLLLANFLGGMGLGQLYFHAIWRSVRGFAAGGRIWPVLLLGLGRLAVLAGALALASRQGALPLLLVLAGLLASRALVLRQLAKAPA